MEWRKGLEGRKEGNGNEGEDTVAWRGGKEVKAGRRGREEELKKL